MTLLIQYNENVSTFVLQHLGFLQVPRGETTLTLEEGKVLFFGLANVGVANPSVDGFRCWLDRRVEPSCNTVTYPGEQKKI